MLGDCKLQSYSTIKGLNGDIIYHKNKAQVDGASHNS